MHFEAADPGKQVWGWSPAPAHISTGKNKQHLAIVANLEKTMYFFGENTVV